MEYHVTYTKKASEDILRLPCDIAIRIKEKITFYRKQENPLKFAKRLKNSIIGTYRF